MESRRVFDLPEGLVVVGVLRKVEECLAEGGDACSVCEHLFVHRPSLHLHICIGMYLHNKEVQIICTHFISR